MRHTGSYTDGIQMAEAQHIGYGQHHRNLEDRCISRVVTTAEEMTLHVGIVADGEGGVISGETASQVVLNSILHSIQASKEDNVHKILRDALEYAHQAVRKLAVDIEDVRSIGTTVTVAAICGSTLYAAHIGNSRAYLVREGMIQQLTLDHTWVNEKLHDGKFKAEEVISHSQKDKLVRYISPEFPLDADIGLRLDNLNPVDSEIILDGYRLQPGDVIVLCTDGLIKERRGVGGYYTEPEEIVNVVQKNEPQDAANTLVSLALGRQVDDNVSVVILEMPGKKTKFAFPIEINTKNVVIALAVLGIFLWAGIAFTGLLPLFWESFGTLEEPKATDTPGFVFVTSNQGIGQYSSPGEQPEPLTAGEYVPIDSGSGIKVIKGPIKLDTTNGTLIFIGDDSNVYINQLADPELGIFDTVLTLESGTALVRLNSGTVTVLFRNGYSAQVSGSIMGADYVSATAFVVDCFDGLVDIYDETGTLISTYKGPHHLLVENGVMFDVDVSRSNSRILRWIDIIGEDNFTELGVYRTPTPVKLIETLPPTPDVIATQECIQQLDLGTPCP
jgi:PPM family protein phosphatase